eukprot:5232603-Prymnesium_polylepis.1
MCIRDRNGSERDLQTQEGRTKLAWSFASSEAAQGFPNLMRGRSATRAGRGGMTRDVDVGVLWALSDDPRGGAVNSGSAWAWVARPPASLGWRRPLCVGFGKRASPGPARAELAHLWDAQIAESAVSSYALLFKLKALSREAAVSARPPRAFGISCSHVHEHVTRFPESPSAPH